MLDYLTIIRYSKGLGLTGRTIARLLDVSKTGVNDFIKAFDECGLLSYPPPPETTNEQIHKIVYGKRPGRAPDPGYRVPDFAKVHEALRSPNMTLNYQWNRYRRESDASGAKWYSYRQYCRMYADWCGKRSLACHFDPVPGQVMEVDFAGKTFRITDPVTAEESPVTVFVAVLAYSKAIYAEGMTDTREQQWISVNNHALDFFGGVPAIVVPDNCKQAVLANRDWRDPELNPAYQEWADWNRTCILPAKARRPTYKPNVENAVGILERGVFHDLEDIPFFSLESFNEALRGKVALVNEHPFAKKEHSRNSLLKEEQKVLLPLPPTPYEPVETRVAKVRTDSHVCFQKAYYSVPCSHANEQVTIRATSDRVRIHSGDGKLLASWERAACPGEWKTSPDHFPEWYGKHIAASEKSILAEAAGIGPSTTRVIEQMLSACHRPEQSFRQCQGVLGHASKHGAAALEACCAEAVRLGRTSYSFIKSMIAGMSRDTDDSSGNTAPAAEGSANAATRAADPSRTEIGNLLSRTARMLDPKKEART